MKKHLLSAAMIFISASAFSAKHHSVIIHNNTDVELSVLISERFPDYGTTPAGFFECHKTHEDSVAPRITKQVNVSRTGTGIKCCIRKVSISATVNGKRVHKDYKTGLKNQGCASYDLYVSINKDGKLVIKD